MLTACERIRQARMLRDLNEILAEAGEPEATLEELERANIVLVPIEEIGGPVEAAVSPFFA